MVYALLTFVLVLVAFATPKIAYALPPPDFLFQASSSFFQLLSIIFVAAGAVFMVLFRWSGIIIQHIRRRPMVLVGFLLFLCSFVFLMISFFAPTSTSPEPVNTSTFEQEVAEVLDENIPKYDRLPVSTLPVFETAPSYLQIHPDLPLIISNDDFATADLSTVFVLDAREDEEFEIGRYAGSTHIRFADLLAGQWTKLPMDRSVVVICWSGIRGEKTADFLRQKGIAARYLEDGADGWVTYGGAWIGEIAFSHVYAADRYRVIFSTEHVKQFVGDGVLLLDTREADVYAAGHIDGSIHISSIFTSSEDLEKKFAEVPSKSTIITVCDDYVSCFDAKIIGIKAEKHGHTFLGRYNTPYAY